MSKIEEKIKTLASPKKVWKAWSDNYLQGLKVGQSGHVVTQRRKGIKFKIQDFKENEHLTIVWYSALAKLVFFHRVEEIENGSEISCQVKLKGFFAFLIQPLVARKIRKYLQQSLKQFSRDLNGLSITPA